MANMTFNANLLPKTNLGFDLGSSEKRWRNIYGYSSNAISWDNTNKKLQQTVSSDGAADVLSFAAGDGIALTGAESSLTIAANTTLLTPPSSSTSYYILFNDTSSTGGGKLYKNSTVRLSIKSGTTSSNGFTSLKLGNSTASGTTGNMEGSILLYSTGSNYIYLCASSGSNSPAYYFPVNNISGSRYVVNIASNTAVGSSLKPVYVASNGVVTECDFTPTTQFNVGKLLYQEGNQNNNSKDVRASEAFTIMHTFWGGDAPAIGKVEGDLSYVTVSLGAGNKVEGRLEIYPRPVSTNNTTPAIIASDIGTTVTSTSAMYHFYADGKAFGTNNEKRTVVSIKRNTATGSATTPVYIDQYGAVTAGSAYAGATAITLNGTSAAAGTASFYAPTDAGTLGQYLKSGGSGTAPTWETFSAATVGLDNVTNDAQVTNIAWDSTNKKITQTIGSNTTDVATQADLQSAIFIISDTAPVDTSVIWLKPVSSSS